MAQRRMCQLRQPRRRLRPLRDAASALVSVLALGDATLSGRRRTRQPQRRRRERRAAKPNRVLGQRRRPCRRPSRKRQTMPLPPHHQDKSPRRCPPLDPPLPRHRLLRHHRRRSGALAHASHLRFRAKVRAALVDHEVPRRIPPLVTHVTLRDAAPRVARHQSAHRHRSAIAVVASRRTNASVIEIEMRRATCETRATPRKRAVRRPDSHIEMSAALPTMREIAPSHETKRVTTGGRHRTAIDAVLQITIAASNEVVVAAGVGITRVVAAVVVVVVAAATCSNTALRAALSVLLIARRKRSLTRRTHNIPANTRRRTILPALVVDADVVAATSTHMINRRTKVVAAVVAVAVVDGINLTISVTVVTTLAVVVGEDVEVPAAVDLRIANFRPQHATMLPLACVQTPALACRTLPHKVVAHHATTIANVSVATTDVLRREIATAHHARMAPLAPTTAATVEAADRDRTPAGDRLHGLRARAASRTPAVVVVAAAAGTDARRRRRVRRSRMAQARRLATLVVSRGTSARRARRPHTGPRTLARSHVFRRPATTTTDDGDDLLQSFVAFPLVCVCVHRKRLHMKSFPVLRTRIVCRLMCIFCSIWQKNQSVIEFLFAGFCVGQQKLCACFCVNAHLVCKDDLG